MEPMAAKEHSNLLKYLSAGLKRVEKRHAAEHVLGAIDAISQRNEPQFDMAAEKDQFDNC